MITTEIAKKNGKLAGTDHVNDLIVNYKKERWVHNSNRLKKADSLSTWYGMTELSEFLELAKQYNADGVKMYYGVYPEKNGVPEEHVGRQTVVLVATKKTTTGNGLTNKDIYIERNGKQEILAFNWGVICPPTCGSGLPEDPYQWSISNEKIGTTIVEGENGFIVI